MAVYKQLYQYHLMTNVLEFKPLIDDPGLSESQPKRICLKKDEDLTKEVKIRLIPEECIFNKEVPSIIS